MDALLALAEKWEAEAEDRAKCCDEASDAFYRGKFWGEACRLSEAARDLRAVVAEMRRAA